MYHEICGLPRAKCWRILFGITKPYLLTAWLFLLENSSLLNPASFKNTLHPWSVVLDDSRVGWLVLFNQHTSLSLVFIECALIWILHFGSYIWILHFALINALCCRLNLSIALWFGSISNDSWNENSKKNIRNCRKHSVQYSTGGKLSDATRVGPIKVAFISFLFFLEVWFITCLRRLWL